MHRKIKSYSVLNVSRLICVIFLKSSFMYLFIKKKHQKWLECGRKGKKSKSIFMFILWLAQNEKMKLIFTTIVEMYENEDFNACFFFYK